MKIKKRQIQDKIFLAENLTYLLSENKLSGRQLSKYTGVREATISNWKRFHSSPDVIQCKKVADFFGLKLDELLFKDCRTIGNISQPNVIYVPIIRVDDVTEWPVSAKHIQGYITTDNSLTDYCYAIKLGSDMMSPRYRVGTCIILDTQQEPVDNDIVLVTLPNDDGPIFHKIFIDELDNRYAFKPMNPKYGAMQIIDKFKLYGVVVRIIEDFL